MNGVEAYAAVSESVGLARKYGHRATAGLVTAVLRRVWPDPPREADLATRASLPNWVVEHWRERFGEERLGAVLAGVNAPAAVGVCLDLRNTTREDAQRALADAGIAAMPSAFAQDVLVLDAAASASELERLAHRHLDLSSGHAQ